MSAVNLAMMPDRGGTPSLTPAESFEQYADLLAEHSAIQPGPRFRLRAGYTNGRHRTTAMLNAGVRRTVIVRWRYPS